MFLRVSPTCHSRHWSSSLLVASPGGASDTDAPASGAESEIEDEMQDEMQVEDAGGVFEGGVWIRSSVESWGGLALEFLAGLRAGGV